MQSPKSQRGKAPGEKPAADNTSETPNGGTNPQRHASGPSSARVPGGLKHSGGRHQGNTEAEAYAPTHSEAPHQGGGPGFAKDKPTGPSGGGSVHQT